MRRRVLCSPGSGTGDGSGTALFRPRTERDRTQGSPHGGANDPNASRRRDDRGQVLIVVLWVVGLLGMLVSAFAFEAHLEARLTSYYRKRLKAEQLARSGKEIAEMLLKKRGEVTVDGEPPEDDRWWESARSLQRQGSVHVVESLGEGTITVDVIPEPARRNINNLDLQGNKNEPDVEENLERILQVGGIPEDMWPQLVDSFQDWIDANDLPRVDGAETEDHYNRLPTPYRAKNGPLDTVGELRLVKGFTKEILSGGVIREGADAKSEVSVSGIEDLLTVYGDGKINVNAASQRVMMTLPGVDELVAGAIIEERDGLARATGKAEGDPFRDEADFTARMKLSQTIQKYITTSSSYYRITSVGEVLGVKRTLWFVVKHDGRTMTILMWREED